MIVFFFFYFLYLIPVLAYNNTDPVVVRLWLRRRRKMVIVNNKHYVQLFLHDSFFFRKNLTRNQSCLNQFIEWTSKASLYFDNANKSLRDTEIETTFVHRHSENIALLSYRAVEFLKSSAKCVCRRVSSFLSLRCYIHFNMAKFIGTFGWVSFQFSLCTRALTVVLLFEQNLNDWRLWI